MITELVIAQITYRIMTQPITKTAACEAAGISVDAYNEHLQHNPELVRQIADLVTSFQQSALMDLEAAWFVGMQKIVDKIKTVDDAADLMALHRYIGKLKAEMEAKVGLNTGRAVDTSFLKTGPERKQIPSRFASFDITQTADGVRIDVLKEADIIPVEPSESDDPEDESGMTSM